MFPDSPFAPARGSFQRPVPVPGASPFDNPLIWVGFNAAWLAYIEGALKQLLLQATWLVNSPTELAEVQQQAFSLLYLFSQFVQGAPQFGSAGADSEDIMIRQDPDNPCLLQTSIDGVNWCTFADISKCVPAVGQSGAGQPQPQPGGGTQNYCQELLANAKLLLPTVVSAGDTVQVVSQTGAGNDGDIVTWYCPDGSYFFAGACIPGTFDTDADDPMPSENHMSLIANIGGTYYSLEHGAINVPGGVSNAQVTIQVNDDNLTNNSGSYQVCVNVTNNQAASWSHDVNFLLTNGGFVPDGVSCTWVPGSGWESGSTDVIIKFAVLHTSTFTKISFVYTWDGTDSGVQAAAAIFYDVIDIAHRLHLDSLVTPGATEQWSGSQSIATKVVLSGNTDGSHPPTLPGSIKLISAHFEGTGVNPFV